MSRQKTAPIPVASHAVLHPKFQYSDEVGIECSPRTCAESCGSCIMFLLSLGAVSALGVIAGGAFWTAKSMYRITDGDSDINARLCTVDADYIAGVQQCA